MDNSGWIELMDAFDHWADLIFKILWNYREKWALISEISCSLRFSLNAFSLIQARIKHGKTNQINYESTTKRTRTKLGLFFDCDFINLCCLKLTRLINIRCLSSKKPSLCTALNIVRHETFAVHSCRSRFSWLSLHSFTICLNDNREWKFRRNKKYIYGHKIY